jgi:hypothetical protein
MVFNYAALGFGSRRDDRTNPKAHERCLDCGMRLPQAGIAEFEVRWNSALTSENTPYFAILNFLN